MRHAKPLPSPLSFRPGKTIRERLLERTDTSNTGQSKFINAALHEFMERHTTPEAVIEAVKEYHLAQVRAKEGGDAS